MSTPRYRCMYCDAPAALGVRCSCQIDPRDTEIATLRRDLAATQREAERLRHGQAIEGDYVCPNALERDRLREQIATYLQAIDGGTMIEVETAESALAATEGESTDGR